ncbi:MAG: phosphoribosylformylglycinamidine cyclo-ligase [Actinomycetota bacterium]|nr:phosphoribosylformylglycinamidine cyclo-ligase [Actinomycetota bacterium]
MPEKKQSYQQAGVDIEKAAQVLDAAKKSITSTFSGQVLNDLSAFAGMFKLNPGQLSNPVLVSSTDGVGTKLLLAQKLNDYRKVGQDLVGMCVNDIICCGARPLFFLDYIACGKIDKNVITTVIKSISDSCITCEASLIGGETAEMPGMYGPNDIDLAGFAVGIVQQPDIIKPDLVQADDVIIGVSSSGLHSNGFSLVRKIIEESKLDLDQEFLPNRSLAQEVLEPTRLYWPFVKEVIYNHKIPVHGIAHITGGGFYDNINRIIPPNLDAVIQEGRWPVKPIFKYLMEKGNIDKKEMYHVFNMGIGLVLITGSQYLEKIRSITDGTENQVYHIGSLNPGKGKVGVEFESQTT